MELSTAYSTCLFLLRLLRSENASIEIVHVAIRSYRCWLIRYFRSRITRSSLAYLPKALITR